MIACREETVSCREDIISSRQDGVVCWVMATRALISGRAGFAEWLVCAASRVPSVARVTSVRDRSRVIAVRRECFLALCSRIGEELRTPPMFAMARANGGWATSVV